MVYNQRENAVDFAVSRSSNHNFHGELFEQMILFSLGGDSNLENFPGNSFIHTRLYSFDSKTSSYLVALYLPGIPNVDLIY